MSRRWVLLSMAAVASGCGGEAQTHERARATAAPTAAAEALLASADLALPRRFQFLALPHLGTLRARCVFPERFALVFHPDPSWDEDAVLRSGGTTLRRHVFRRSAAFTLRASRDEVGDDVVNRTAPVDIRLRGTREPYDVRARIRLRLAEARDGTPRCVATKLRATSRTLFH